MRFRLNIEHWVESLGRTGGCAYGHQRNHNTGIQTVEKIGLNIK